MSHYVPYPSPLKHLAKTEMVAVSSQLVDVAKHLASLAELLDTIGGEEPSRTLFMPFALANRGSLARAILYFLKTCDPAEAAAAAVQILLLLGIKAELPSRSFCSRTGSYLELSKSGVRWVGGDNEQTKSWSM